MLTLIGDIHGKTSQYLKIIEKVGFSLQLGDFGFNDSYEILNQVDSSRHKVLKGNHCSYSHPFYPHVLPDFGEMEFGAVKFFFLRGGFSIDWKYRVEGVSWWKEEELSYAQLEEAIDLYISLKPHTVITHECPSYLCNLVAGVKTFNGEVIKPSRTSFALQRMFEAHPPGRWIFGHHHKSWALALNGTYFRCLAELETLPVY